jgi:beta-lactamase regulating signal transducer with metallopeptidase domain
MAWMIGQLNMLGNAFLEYAIPIQIESAVVLGLVLILECALRKAVRPAVRYWLVTCTVIFFLLSPFFSLYPPSYCLPPGNAAYADPTTHTGAVSAQDAANDGPMAAEGTLRLQTSASGGPKYANASLSRRITVQPQTTVDGRGERDGIPATYFDHVQGTRPQTREGLTWPGVILAAWLAGAAGLTVVMVSRTLAMRRRVAGSCPANSLMMDILSYCRRRMGVNCPVRLRVAPAGTPPALCGLLETTIVVPDDLAPTLGSGHLRTVLLHQLAHVRRNDLWVGLIQNVATILYFYNPFIWLANRAIRRLRDQAADQAVLDSVSGEHRWYSRRLADVADLTGRSGARPGLAVLA